MNNHKELSRKHFDNIGAPYAFELLTPREQKLAKFFNEKSVDWIKAWSAGDGDFSDNKDAIVWGISLSDMLTVAMRVLRHKTGAMPIPELTDKPPIFQREPGEIPHILKAVKALIGENSIAKESALSLEIRLENLRAYLENLVAASKI